jgi:hypothetical protein
MQFNEYKFVDYEAENSTRYVIAKKQYFSPVFH